MSGCVQVIIIRDIGREATGMTYTKKKKKKKKKKKNKPTGSGNGNGGGGELQLMLYKTGAPNTIIKQGELREGKAFISKRRS